jgi:hypothetical protein
MSASGTWNFNPSIGSIGAYCLGRSDVRRSAIDMGHLADVAVAANLVLGDWSLDEPNLWNIELVPITLTQGVTEYTLPANVLMVLDCFIRTTDAGVQNDRIIYGVSRSEYAAYPNKLYQAFPTVYWADRVVPIQVSLYPTPDGNGPYTLNIWCVQQDQDASLGAAGTLDIPYRMFSPFVDALAAKLALTYKPERFPMLEQVAMKSYAMARAQENEEVPIYIIPGLNGYYR